MSIYKPRKISGGFIIGSHETGEGEERERTGREWMERKEWARRTGR
jgi:hypothetical protein